MQIQKLKYAIKEDRGVILSAKRNVIRVGDPDPTEKAFESLQDCGRHISRRGAKLIEQLRVRTESGEIDTEATEIMIEAHYTGYYATIDQIAVDWELGLVLERNQPEPVRYDGKLYDVEQGHTVVDPNHTPDVVPALYTEIPAPTPGLDCVEWYEPTSTKNYSKGECVAYTDGFYYESKINNNVWSPAAYPQGWEKLGPIG